MYEVKVFTYTNRYRKIRERYIIDWDISDADRRVSKLQNSSVLCERFRSLVVLIYARHEVPPRSSYREIHSNKPIKNQNIYLLNVYEEFSKFFYS